VYLIQEEDDTVRTGVSYPRGGRHSSHRSILAKRRTTQFAQVYLRQEEDDTGDFDMFQTFSGTSRRPRQVNLSGQNVNAFAANSWTPVASGTQKTIANAQQERLQRQQEREKLNAAKRIQRIWRGHKVRRDLADARRNAWDRTEAVGGSGSEAALTEQLRLLIAFFSAWRQDDLKRLENVSQRIASAGYQSFLSREAVQPRIARLANIILEALQM
jgi:ubiquitin-protein ligase E3 C